MKGRQEILSEISKFFPITSIEMMDASDEDMQAFMEGAKVEYAHVDANGADVAIVSYKNEKRGAERQAAFVWANGQRHNDVNADSLRKQVKFVEI